VTGRREATIDGLALTEHHALLARIIASAAGALPRSDPTGL